MMIGLFLSKNGMPSGSLSGMLIPERRWRGCVGRSSYRRIEHRGPLNFGLSGRPDGRYMPAINNSERPTLSERRPLLWSC
jgi:hypothetical protein